MTTLGLIVGEWIFLGGDAVGNKFVTNLPGYARVKAISATYIDFDETTFVASTEAGTGKNIRIFFGKAFKNELAASIKRRSYQLERRLGNDGVGIQSELVTGAFANTLTLNIPSADKINIDLGFVGMNYETRSGTDGLKSGTRVSAPNDSAFNTSSVIYRMKMSILDAVTMNPSALFGFVTDAKIALANGVKPNKALGVMGAFDASAGDFEITGSVTAYFSTVASAAAIKNNSDVELNVIIARANTGFIVDIPLMGIGGGKNAVAKDTPITLPIEMMAARNVNDYTLLATVFSYLPNAAMPV